jgi:hypothetical protein
MMLEDDFVVLEVPGGSVVLGCPVQLRSVNGMRADSLEMPDELDLLEADEAATSGNGGV